ncbi:ferredoxin [Actinomadura madurae]|uniref:ferredoxin n=1 Tax=Actinomadura madurae TaxID=1993 RepID=UPI0020D2572C|nr:ferredoxin [Actinomadura madurae]MCP9948208.1 ferredoxin [Actinomadura madurae]
MVLREWHARIPDYRIAPGARLTERGGQLTMPNLPSNGRCERCSCRSTRARAWGTAAATRRRRRLLSDDEEGFVAQRGQAFEVPDGMLDEARDAADACPEGAISLRAAVDADA